MPLAHKLSSMIFIMPNHVEPLERVEKLLNREQLKAWAGKMKKRSVAISLPKVILEVSHDLQVKEVLKENSWALQFFGVGGKIVGRWVIYASHPFSSSSLTMAGKNWTASPGRVANLSSPPRNTWLIWA